MWKMVVFGRRTEELSRHDRKLLPMWNICWGGDGGLESVKVNWSWREESNLQPAVYKTAALPIELRQRTVFELVPE